MIMNDSFLVLLRKDVVTFGKTSVCDQLSFCQQVFRVDVANIVHSSSPAPLNFKGCFVFGIFEFALTNQEHHCVCDELLLLNVSFLLELVKVMNGLVASLDHGR
jgi:hypothetical protein